MSTIRCIYHPNQDGSRREPGFPATDQHPDAARYPLDHATFGLLNIDAIGGAPSLAEVDALLNPPPRTVDEREADCLAYLNGGSGVVDLRKVLKAHVISCEAFRLGVAPGALTGPQLLAIRNRISAIYRVL